MKILYLITGLNPGGAEKNLKEIISRLPRETFEISVCSLTKTLGIVEEIRPFIKNLYFLNANSYFDFFKSLIKLRKIIKNESPKILHCFLFHANILGRLAAINFNIKVICSIRNKLLNNKIGNWIDCLTQNLVDLYTVNSRSLHKFVINYGIKHNKIKIVENLIDFNHLKPLKIKEEMKKGLGLDDAPIISMIAHIRKQKDYPSILKAIHLLVKKGLSVNFLIVGDNHIQLNETRKILKLISKLNLKNVKLLGLRRDIPDILNITDVWVSSTLFEGQSNALLEAMAMKIPIVTTNIEENAEVVRNNKEALLVPIKNPCELASNIKKLILDKNLSKTLVENAYKRVKRKYDLNKQITKLMRIYKVLISKNERKIKVCLISHFGYPLYNNNCKGPFGGGAGVQLFLLSKEMMYNKNISISVLTGNYSNNKSKIELYKNKIKIYKVLPIQRKLINYFKGIVIFFFTLKRINPDIIIQRAASALTGFSAIYCKLVKKKFIYSISSNSNVTGEDEKGYIGKIFKYGLDNANYIVAQNYEQINKLESYKKKKISNIIMIKNGFEIKYPKNVEKRSILWVGRAIRLKRPELFLKLAQKFPNEEFIMICYKERYSNYWNTIFKEASKFPNLKFLEYVPFNKIDQFFKKAKVFINTSTYEGFPNTFIQAFKNETPILSLNVNPDNILTEHKIGFFCNNNLREMETNLKFLLENEDLYKSYSTNSILYAKNKHDIKKTSKKWTKLVETVFF